MVPQQEAENLECERLISQDAGYHCNDHVTGYKMVECRLACYT